MLKIAADSDDESIDEADALRLWDGDGAVRVLRHDTARRALLLERARPGHDASALEEREAVRAALDVGRRLWRRAERGRPYEWVGDRVPEWLARAGQDDLVAAAAAIYARLRPGGDTLVHGDLHHFNLLRSGDRWVAIDPKPMLAEPEYDIPTLLWNPLGRYEPTLESVERRIAICADAGLDAGRIRAWAIVRGAYLGIARREGDERPQHRVARLLLER